MNKLTLVTTDIKQAALDVRLINRATINVDNGSTSRIELHKCEDKS